MRKECTIMYYQPKGGMCASCDRRSENCSHMDFAGMQVIARSGQAAIVRCRNHQKSTKGFWPTTKRG